MSDYPVVNSHNSWSKLEEVWLGDIYPDSWYSHLPDEIEDTFCRINEITRQDLKIIQDKLLEFDVVVRRPKYTNIENHIVNDKLEKPEITPRDYAVVMGNQLVTNHRCAVANPGSSWHYLHGEYYPHVVSGYDLEKNFNNTSNQDRVFWHRSFHGANVVRYGNQVLWDTMAGNTITKAHQQEVAEIFPDFEWHFVDNGGHLDGCFHIVRPGLLLTTWYFEDYDNFFPGWERITINDPEYANYFADQPPKMHNHNGRWWLQGVTMPGSFNKHIVQLASDWVGDPQETFFEVNALVLDEHNICLLGENQGFFNLLEKQGITVHSLPFRARTFWDGGLHCLTVDIRRQSKLEDVFSIDTAEFFK